MSITLTVSRTFDNETDGAKWLSQVSGGGSQTSNKAAAETTEKAASAGKAASKTASKPKVTQEQMQAALNEVKEKFGVPDAKAIISDVGGVKKMDDIPADKYEAVFKACQEKLESEGADDDADEGGI